MDQSFPSVVGGDLADRIVLTVIERNLLAVNTYLGIHRLGDRPKLIKLVKLLIFQFLFKCGFKQVPWQAKL